MLTKTTGKEMFLSDIPVHPEQDPLDSVYFDPHDPNDLADKLERSWADLTPGPSEAENDALRVRRGVSLTLV